MEGQEELWKKIRVGDDCDGLALFNWLRSRCRPLHHSHVKHTSQAITVSFAFWIALPLEALPFEIGVSSFGSTGWKSILRSWECDGAADVSRPGVGRCKST